MSSPWFERDPASLRALEHTLRARYPTLHVFLENGTCHVRGTIAMVENDRYQLEIELPDDYPNSLPLVWETGGRIPWELDRHVLPIGALCLGVPLRLGIALKGRFDIESILEIPVRNFLIGNSLVERGEDWPHGDRAHGVAGILEEFDELIGTDDKMRVSRFLLDVLQGKIRGHWPCPCGSGLVLRKCHREGWETIRKAPRWLLHHSLDAIMKDLERRTKKARAG